MILRRSERATRLCQRVYLVSERRGSVRGYITIKNLYALFYAEQLQQGKSIWSTVVSALFTAPSYEALGPRFTKIPWGLDRIG